MTTATVGIHHARIPVSDLARSTEFWREVFGFEVDFEFPGDPAPAGVALSQPVSGARVVLWADPARAANAAGSVSVGLSVPRRESLDDLASALSSAGVRHGGIRPALVEAKLIDIEDPDGNLVNVYVEAS